MTTREQLEAEAAELYPVLNWDPYHQEPVETYGYEECQQEAHVRAKTVTAEQVEAAVASMREQCPDSAPNWFDWIWHRFAHAAFRAAGFYVTEG